MAPEQHSILRRPVLILLALAFVAVLLAIELREPIGGWTVALGFRQARQAMKSGMPLDQPPRR